jgi:cell division protein ZapA
MGQPIEVEIFGQRYTLSGDANEAYVRELARYVDGKMREIADAAGGIPVTKLALLVAINIAHELHRSREQQKAREAFLGNKTQDLIDTIDQEFGDLKLY